MSTNLSISEIADQIKVNALTSFRFFYLSVRALAWCLERRNDFNTQ